jgi:hypothetical protein
MLRIFTLALIVTFVPHADPQVEVVTKTDDSYQVSGRLFFDNQYTGSSATVKAAASCIGCKWHLQLICADPFKTQIDGNYDCTKPASYSCSSAAKRYRVWFLGEGLWRPSDWQQTGTTCLGPAGPKPIVNLQTELTQTATGYLPELKVELKPKTNSLVNLPTKVIVRSANTYTFTTEVSGIQVTVTATAAYRYTFGDGYSVISPARSISHIYRNRGDKLVNVTATWQAAWSSALHGTNPVSGAALTQTKQLTASVLAARGRLINR